MGNASIIYSYNMRYVTPEGRINAGVPDATSLAYQLYFDGVFGRPVLRPPPVLVHSPTSPQFMVQDR